MRSSCIRKHFCAFGKVETLETYSYQIVRLLDFKIIMNILLEEKIFHYSVLNYSVNELVDLQKITRKHQKMLLDISTKLDNSVNLSKSLFIDQKVSSFNCMSVFLSYIGFLELIKYLHENKEDHINNLIREIFENIEVKMYLDKKHKNFTGDLIKLRDELRQSLSPEVLDQNSNQIYNLSYLDKINLEANKILFNKFI